MNKINLHNHLCLGVVQQRQLQGKDTDRLLPQELQLYFAAQFADNQALFVDSQGKLIVYDYNQLDEKDRNYFGI